MHGCQPFFISRTLKEVERLLPVVAKGNGGVRCFKAKALEKTLATTHRGGSFAIYFDADKYSRLYPDAPERNAARWRARMASFLLGYLAAEATHRRTTRLITTARANKRIGRTDR